MDTSKKPDKKLPTHTMDQLFVAYSKFQNISPDTADGKTISLRQIDKWFRQAKLFDKSGFSTTDTGVEFFKFKKKALTYEEYIKFLDGLCQTKQYDIEELKEKLLICGLPGKGAMATD